VTNIMAIRKAARVVVDEQGQSVVQIPLPLWEELLSRVESGEPLQHTRIKALLADWASQPDDTSDEWWDELQTFLKEHRVNFEAPPPYGR
jgi:hypothetical protein